MIVWTDHDLVDYQLVAEHSGLVIDTRNVFHRMGVAPPSVVKF